jgi:hypothetical protein
MNANQIDFVYDSGTHHGVLGEREREILKDVIDDPVLLEGVGGQTTLSRKIGETIFGKTRVLRQRQGSVLVFNYSTCKKWQVVNPNPDTFILQGWGADTPYMDPETIGKKFQFIPDEERYGDPLLHCTLPLKVAKSFVDVEKRVVKFYDPPRVPEVSDSVTKETVSKVDIAHRKWNHASAQELKRITVSDPMATGVNTEEIDIWKKVH